MLSKVQNILAEFTENVSGLKLQKGGVYELLLLKMQCVLLFI